MKRMAEVDYERLVRRTPMAHRAEPRDIYTDHVLDATRRIRSTPKPEPERIVGWLTW